MMVSETPKYQPIYYVRYARAPDGASVTFSGMDPAGNTLTGTLQPDTTAGMLKEQVTYKGPPATETIEMDGDRFAEEVQQGSDYTASSTRPRAEPPSRLRYRNTKRTTHGRR